VAPAVAPPDQLDRRVALLHRLGELDRVRDRLVLAEADCAIRRLVSDLPELQLRVRDPVGGLARIARPRRIALLAVAQEVDAVERLGPDATAEVDELVRADAVRLRAAPHVVPHRRTLGRRPDALAPLVIPAEQASEADRPRREVAHDVDEVFAPVV